jgi:hypothetical protein
MDSHTLSDEIAPFALKRLANLLRSLFGDDLEI